MDWTIGLAGYLEVGGQVCLGIIVFFRVKSNGISEIYQRMIALERRWWVLRSRTETRHRQCRLVYGNSCLFFFFFWLLVARLGSLSV